MSLFVAVDAEGEPTIWRDDLPPRALLRRCDVRDADLWDLIAAAVEAS